MPLEQRQVQLYRILLVALIVVVSYLAFTPIKYPVISRLPDKLNHLSAFFALALVTDFSFPDVKYGLKKMLPLLGYGLLIEIVQHHLPYRQFDLLDLCADAVGLLLYAASVPLIRRMPLLRRRWA